MVTPTFQGKEHCYVKSFIFVQMRSVLESMSSVQAVHPRLHRLYALLKKNLHLGPQHGQMYHAINLSKALKPAAYDANKLNRIFTTTPDWIA